MSCYLFIIVLMFVYTGHLVIMEMMEDSSMAIAPHVQLLWAVLSASRILWDVAAMEMDICSLL